MQQPHRTPSRIPESAILLPVPPPFPTSTQLRAPVDQGRDRIAGPVSLAESVLPTASVLE